MKHKFWLFHIPKLTYQLIHIYFGLSTVAIVSWIFKNIYSNWWLELLTIVGIGESWAIVLMIILWLHSPEGKIKFTIHRSSPLAVDILSDSPSEKEGDPLQYPYVKMHVYRSDPPV